MKKMILAAGALLLSLGMFAQNPSFYVKAGVGMSKWVGEDVEKDYSKFLTGYSAVVGFEQPLTEAFVFGAELGAQTRGVKTEVLKENVKYLVHDMTISPFLGYHFATGSMDIEPHVGLVASYDLVGKIISGDSSVKLDFKEQEDWKRLGVAVNPGVTCWFGQFGLDLTWQRGILSLDEDLKIFDNQLLVRVAYRF